MKKLILFAAFCLIGLGSFAQASLASSTTPTLNNKVDTVTNTGNKVMTSSVRLPTTNGKLNTTISAVLTLISGTGAGTVVVQGSLDGVNFQTLAASQLQGAQTASYTITNVASQSCNFVVAGAPFLYYRTLTTGSGTEVISVSGKIY